MFKTSLKNYFAQSTRDKGTELYTSHSISAFFPTSAGMTMRVQDHVSHPLRFEQINEKIWQPQCPCLDFESTGACRHLWAAVLYVDSESNKKPNVKLWLKGQKIEAKIVAWFSGSKKSPARKSKGPEDLFRRQEWEFFIDAMSEAADTQKISSKKSLSRQLALVLNPKRSRSLDRLVFNLYARNGSNERYKKTTVNARETQGFPADHKLLEFFLDLEAAHGDPTYPRTSLELNNPIFHPITRKD